jgi:RNA polymerase sigma factor (sigma-70 family)
VIRVLLVDDHALLRGGLRTLVEAQEDMVVAGEAADGRQAVALARELDPDVILMDIGMPGLDGVSASREILADRRQDSPKILILTTFEDDGNVFGAIRAGASGFLLKDTATSELLRAIRVLAHGGALLAPNVTRRLIGEIASQPERREVLATELQSLTEREREVMALAAAGLSNQEIAAELVISIATAKTHVSRAMRKLRAHDRAQLVSLAYTSGLVVPRVTP